ncbi:amine dehydrogenase large subunit [Pseudohongiella acticola]|uniref:amine dehydrogenase large subunit n=1 Tax=Pseudohongiella acticola TaxID=1524254 RepID=UPI001FDF6CC6|nr:amine dehydrogenase large subunit [Pseudohongiella acticola]
MKIRMLALAASLAATGVVNAQWDTVVGDTGVIEGFDQHWVTVRRGDTVFLVDADEGVIGGTLLVSSFSPALAPRMSAGLIYAYGSYYSRGSLGDRTDVVQIYDAATATAISEVEIPARAAGIGHPGMMGLINDRFAGVWNITPATSVSLVDIESETFVGEVSLPSCSGIYPEAEGWISVCGDGTAQYIQLNTAGQETRRIQSASFFDVFTDPVYDYSVPAADGWMFMSFEGLLRKVSLDGDNLVVSEAFDINPESDGTADVNGVMPKPDDNWRIGSYQPFAYHDGEALLATLMHDGGGQETFEKPGTELWIYNMITGNRGVRIELGEDVTARGVLITPGDDPLLLLATSDGLQVRDPRSGRLLRTVENVSGTMQALYEGMQ